MIQRVLNTNWFESILCFLAFSVLSIFGFIILFLIQQSLPFFEAQGLFSLFQKEWYPLEGFYGQLPMLLGSILVTFFALCIGLLLGLSSAIALAFFLKGKVQTLLEFCIDLLSGLPSVVLGLWGLTAIVPLMAQAAPPGTNLLTASFILGIMITPIICMSSLAIFRLIPHHLLLSAQALGLSRATYILSIALPCASKGIFSGVLLAGVRALGETMAVMMVAGNISAIPQSIVSPVRTLTSNIALEMAYAMDTHRASLYLSGLGLTLFVLVFVIVQTRIFKEVS